MVQEYLELRKRLHGGGFHLDLPAELWRASYLDRPGVGAEGVIEVRRDGELKGYAICSVGEVTGGGKSLQVLEFAAESRGVMAELLDKLVSKAKENSIDLISLTSFDEPYDDLLAKNGFIDFSSAAVLVALINPLELLTALSSEGVTGGRLNLEIVGFDPISLVVGDSGFKVIDYTPDAEITLSMNDKSFVNVTFGKTSAWKDLLKGRIKVRGKARLGIARRFFAIIKQEKLYIPPGDGI